MKQVITTQKKVRLTPASFTGYSDNMSIEGNSIKEVINTLMNDLQYQDWYSTSGPSTQFGIFEYEVGEVPVGSHNWAYIRDEERINDLKAFQTRAFGSSPIVPETTKIYFNQKVVMLDDEIQKLITGHRGYKNMVRLWKEVEKARNATAVQMKADQIAIKKENDIFLLANIMKKNGRDFKKILKAASTLEATLPEELKLTMGN